MPQVLLFQDQNYGLHYEYTVPSDPLPDNQSSKESGPLFMWTHAGWGDCNATCGGALRDASKQSINSDWKIEHSGAFSLAGTTVHYIRRGLWEKISAKGPTTTPLHLLVRGRNGKVL